MQGQNWRARIRPVADAKNGTRRFFLQELLAKDMTNIEEIREVIRHLHRVEATHLESVPVKETFQGRTIWDGIVEVFQIHGHPKADKIYAWAHDADNPEHPRRHVTVLHIPPVTSPILAVRAAIVQEQRHLAAEET
jgi:hypothetical protein